MKDVYIIDNKGTVDAPKVNVSKKGNEQVTWHNQANKDATVKFDSPSPFGHSEFKVQAGQSALSGLPTVDPSPTSYKYTVIGQDGENDPVVIVDN